MKSFFLIFVIMPSLIFSQTNQQINNLKSFAKVYGYVKYFHPSDEASTIDWGKFSIYGAQEVLKCETNEALIKTLNNLFLPIAPSIVLSDNNLKDYDLSKITPINTSEYNLIYWQHLGVGTDMKPNLIYKSKRVKSTKKNIKGNALFDFEPKIGELINEKIGENIFCQIPLVLYSKNTTFPKSNPAVLKSKFVNLINVNTLALRLGNVINTYNVFQHFYPYFDVVDIDWDNELVVALNNSFIDKTEQEHIITLQKLTASLKDGHISVIGGHFGGFTPAIKWEWIEDKLIITNVYDEKIDLNIGDEVTRINHQDSKEYFREIESRISAGTEGYLAYIAKTYSLIGKKNTEITLTIYNKDIVLKRDKDYYKELRRIDESKESIKEISENIYYINLDKASMESINLMMPKLEKCQSIICDMRGYPKNNDNLISHFLKEDDKVDNWMQVSKIVYPNQNNIVGFVNFGWNMKPKKPYLGNKKILFIIDGQAISYAESYMGYIEGYKLATIIGQPTAGTNGNVNTFVLPGGYSIRFTGMKVLKLDGTQHHGIGILPNIYINKTIEGVKSGKDEFLEKAIELAKI